MDSNIVLFFDSPLLSWGYESQFYEKRKTASHPTKSAITGLICAARGIEKDNEPEIAKIAGLRLTTYSFGNPERMIDFHIVQPIQAVTKREYLQECKFAAILTGEATFIQEIANKLINPVWMLYIGRKACVPASPIFQGVFEKKADAEAKINELCGSMKISRLVKDTEPNETATDVLRDVPVNFATMSYYERNVSIINY